MLIDCHSVDYQTDFKIQQLIRDEFQEHTLISITHRQETIKEFDRVIVMENGRVVEIITPREFLGKE
jgi:ATP-binding cassette subfamily C (CFTR/MRP) protein 1